MQMAVDAQGLATDSKLDFILSPLNKRTGSAALDGRVNATTPGFERRYSIHDSGVGSPLIAELKAQRSSLDRPFNNEPPGPERSESTEISAANCWTAVE